MTSYAGGDPIPVAAPPRVAARIATAPDGPVRVLHACAGNVHLDLGGYAVGVTAAGVPGLPHALRTGLSSLLPAGPASSAEGGSSAALPTAYVDSGLLHLCGRALVTRRFVDVRAPRFDAARMPSTSPAVLMGTPRSPDAGLVALTLGPGLDGPIDAATVADLVGNGDGLTPLGDDVLCGWLAAHRAAGVATPDVDDACRRALPRTTTLSATLLECALAGEAADPALAYLRALGSADVTEAADARRALCSVGHSSGSGLAYGIDLALRTLTQEVAA